MFLSLTIPAGLIELDITDPLSPYIFKVYYASKKSKEYAG